MSEYKKLIEDGPEVLIYMAVESLGAYNWRMRHDHNRGHITEENWAGIEKVIEKNIELQNNLVKSITRFGVDPFDENDKPTTDYWKWYKWWNNWHQNTLSNEEWYEVDAMLDPDMTEDEIKHCRPEGSWQEYEI